MPRRPNVGTPCPGRCEAKGVFDRPGFHLLVAHQSGQDGQACRIGRRPGVGPKIVGIELEERARVRAPRGAAALRERVEEFGQGARSRRHDQHVAISVTRRSTLDRCVRWNRIGTGIALVVVEEAHRHRRLARRYDNIRNSDRRSRPGWPVARAEIRMDIGVGTDRIDIGIGSRVERQGVDTRVPDAVGRKERATGDLLRKGHGAAQRGREQEYDERRRPGTRAGV